MKNIGGDSRSKFDATLHGISLASAKRMMGSAASTGPVAIAGTLERDCDGHMGKDLRRSHCSHRRDDPRRRGQAQHTTLAASMTPSQSAGSKRFIDAGPVPIEGDLHATYTGKTQQLALDHSYFRTPQTNLNLNGTISKSSSLAVQLQANDLREVESIADLFRTPAPGQPLQPLGLAGTASFNWRRPRFNLSAASYRPAHRAESSVPGIVVEDWSAPMSMRALRSVSLQHAELDPATQGRLTLNASAQLRKWSFSKSSPVQLQLNASQLDISELAKLAGQQIPATGNARRRHQDARQCAQPRRQLAP